MAVIPCTGREVQAAHLEFGQRLEVLNEALGVIVEDDAGIEQVLRVENLLQLAHGGKGFLAPLILDKGRHVAARAVLGLERAVVVLDHEARHVAHHGGIALHLALVAEDLVDDEVVVALEGVAVDAGVPIAVVGNEFLQFDGGFGQVLDSKGDILDEARGAHGARAAHAGEDARADGPVLAVDGGVGGERDGDIGLEARQARGDGVDTLLQVLGGHGLGLGEDGGEVVVVAGLHTRDFAGIHISLVLQIDGVIDRCQRQVVEHLGALDHQVLPAHGDVLVAGLQPLEGDHRLATLAHGEEIEHRRRLAWIVVQRAHRHLADEGQRALAAHYAVGDDVKRVIVGDERPQVQACDVLDAVFLADTVSQRLVGADAVAQGLDARDEVRMALAERLAARLVTRVEHGAVGQHQTRRQQHAVTVSMGAAVHARGVVGDDAAHHRRADARGVGREDASQGFQDLVHSRAHDAGLQGDAVTTRGNGVVLPVLTRHNQDAVAHALARQRRARRTEGERQAIPVGHLDDG